MNFSNSKIKNTNFNLMSVARCMCVYWYTCLLFLFLFFVSGSVSFTYVNVRAYLWMISIYLFIGRSIVAARLLDIRCVRIYIYIDLMHACVFVHLCFCVCVYCTRFDSCTRPFYLCQLFTCVGVRFHLNELLNKFFKVFQ